MMDKGRLLTINELLEEHETDLSYHEIISKLKYHDFVDYDEAPTDKGGTESFLVLTEKGAVFGMDGSTSDDKWWITTPHFYENRFPVLLELLEALG